jgi:hypothetical protein
MDAQTVVVLVMGGMYSVGGQILCESCAVKKTGGELLPSTEKTDLIRPYLIGGGK